MNYCESFEIITLKENQEIIPEKFINSNRQVAPAIKAITLATNQDTNIYINGNPVPVLVKAKYGLQLLPNTILVKSIVVEKSGTEIYGVYSY